MATKIQIPQLKNWLLIRSLLVYFPNQDIVICCQMWPLDWKPWESHPCLGNNWSISLTTFKRTVSVPCFFLCADYSSSSGLLTERYHFIWLAKTVWQRATDPYIVLIFKYVVNPEFWQIWRNIVKRLFITFFMSDLLKKVITEWWHQLSRLKDLQYRLFLITHIILSFLIWTLLQYLLVLVWWLGTGYQAVQLQYDPCEQSV